MPKIIECYDHAKWLLYILIRQNLKVQKLAWSGRPSYRCSLKLNQTVRIWQKPLCSPFVHRNLISKINKLALYIHTLKYCSNIALMSFPNFICHNSENNVLHNLFLATRSANSQHRISLIIQILLYCYEIHECSQSIMSNE